MSNSAHGPGSDRGSDVPPSDTEGSWGLDLWSGTAWFSDWFYERLKWPRNIKRQRLDDLRSHVSAEDWHALLLGIRGHLELQTPFDVQLKVQIAEGQSQCWRIHGSAERNVGGQPVNVTGSAQDVTTEL
jgi:hypothetical protein